jgi:dihydroflavonol-4-reductase
VILVTGATGHIGNVLVRALAGTGQPVRALVLPGENRSPLDGLPIELVEGDVLDPVSLDRAVAGVWRVFHLAGVISILPGQDTQVWRVNVEGTCNTLAACRRAGVRRLIYTSSIHAIAWPAAGELIDERLPFDPIRPRGEYDRAKAQASLAVLQAAHLGLDAVLACPTGVIGPYDYQGSLMGRLIRDASRRRVHFTIDGAYDFVDVRDVVQGLLAAAELGRPGEHYIFSGERLTVSELLRLVAEVAGLRATQVHLPFWMAQLACLILTPLYRHLSLPPRLTPYALQTLRSPSSVSSQKARRELGYSTRPLRESLADTVSWLGQHGDHPLWPAPGTGRATG